MYPFRSCRSILVCDAAGGSAEVIVGTSLSHIGFFHPIPRLIEGNKGVLCINKLIALSKRGQSSLMAYAGLKYIV